MFKVTLTHGQRCALGTQPAQFLELGFSDFTFGDRASIVLEGDRSAVLRLERFAKALAAHRHREQRHRAALRTVAVRARAALSMGEIEPGSMGEIEPEAVLQSAAEAWWQTGSVAALLEAVR